MKQPKLPGFDKFFQTEKSKEHKRWAESILRSMVKSHPATAEEWEIMLSGIRIDRFVSPLECEKCKFPCEDHTLGSTYLTKICLKDYYALRHRLGLKE